VGSHHIEQLVKLQRLVNIIVKGHVLDTSVRFTIVVGRAGDNWNRASLWVPTEHLGNSEAIHVRHANVENNKIGMEARDGQSGFKTRLGGLDFKTTLNR